MTILSVIIGGFIGSISRYCLSVLFNKHFFGTWLANISGSILLALLLKYHLAGHLPDLLWPLLGTGFCGSYTTFSTFGYESLTLIRKHKYLSAVSYMAVSLLLSLSIVYYILI